MSDLGISTSSSNAHLARVQLSPSSSKKALSASTELTDEEKKQVQELKRRDQEVRRHEQAHKAAAGPHATGGPTYEYQRGPDGRNYAIGGEVQIDLSEVEGDPQATIQKARAVRRAALAPKDPSAQDRQVAAEASKLEAKARQELNKERKEESKIYDESGENHEKNEASVVDVFA